MASNNADTARPFGWHPSSLSWEDLVVLGLDLNAVKDSRGVPSFRALQTDIVDLFQAVGIPTRRGDVWVSFARAPPPQDTAARSLVRVRVTTTVANAVLAIGPHLHRVNPDISPRIQVFKWTATTMKADTPTKRGAKKKGDEIKTYDDGYAEGHKSGYFEGYNDGYLNAYDKGYAEGYAAGRGMSAIDENNNNNEFDAHFRISDDDSMSGLSEPLDTIAMCKSMGIADFL